MNLYAIEDYNSFAHCVLGHHPGESRTDFLEKKLEINSPKTRPEVSEADPQRYKINQKVTGKCLICEVSKMNPENS